MMFVWLVLWWVNGWFITNKSIVLWFLYTTMIGTLWEIKDGLVPFKGDKVEGFSVKDLIADILGAGSIMGVFLLI
jgi:hypothetical protein